MTDNEKLFEELKPRYLKAYQKSNGNAIWGELVYKKGYVKKQYVSDGQPVSETFGRLSKFKEATETLEARVKSKKI